jgi:hypothetical protein
VKIPLPQIDATYVRIRDDVTLRVIDAVGGEHGFVRLARVDSPGPRYNVRLADFPTKYRAISEK